jgi:hypothetical protein
MRMSSDPPSLPAWLLEHLRFGSTGEALIGDLLEEYRRGRSSAWYWRQALRAILAGYTGEVRRHWVLVARAVCIGVLASYWASMLGHFLVVDAYRRFGITHGLGYSLAGLVSNAFFAGAISGWVVVRLHRSHQDAVPVTLAGASLVWRFVSVIGADLTRASVHCLFVLAGVCAGGSLIHAPHPEPRD